jgi:urocanate hydratase
MTALSTNPPQALATREGVRAARGETLRCRGWRQEGLLRMLENVLEVGERPADLVVYAAQARAARDWAAYDALVAALKTLEDDQTLVVQSGRPVGIFRSSPLAPVVVSATGNLVGRFATPESFADHTDRDLVMWGGLTAGAWQYIGAQGVLQGTYEVLMEIARRHFGGTLAGRVVLTAGLGGMGSAQPLAVKLAGGAAVIAEVDPAKLAARHDAGLLDLVAPDPGTALEVVEHAARNGRPVAVGLAGNAAEVYPELVRKGFAPDVVTDQTAAHDALYGYAPPGLDPVTWAVERARDPERVTALARAGMADQVRAMLTFAANGSVVFENGNNLRWQAREAGVKRAFELPGFAQAYLRPLFSRGIGPFRWVALSGERADLDRLDDLAATLFPERPEVAKWIALARENVPVQGLPARSCWLGHGERSRFALAANALVASGELDAPVLFSRDHLDAAGMTHPYIGTEGMRDGSDAVSDWPILDALLLTSAGADLVAVHAGGAGYAGLMQSAGVSTVADGTPAAARRLADGLDADTGLGVLRYAATGEPDAIDAARTAGLGL